MMPALLPNRHHSRETQSFWRVLIVSVVWITSVGWPLMGPEAASGQAPKDVPWLTGRKLDELNQTPISAWWSGAELRERIMRFSNNQRLGIFLDRRVDPSTIIEISAPNVTKEQFLWAVAKSSNLGICRIEDFYYFGPTEFAASLPTVCKLQRQVTTKQRKNSKVDWNQRKPLKTGAIVEPKLILLDLAKENQFQIENPEAIPHDIWAGFELPATSLQVRVAILLVGFGKSFERIKDGSAIRIIDFPDIKTSKASFAKLENARSMAVGLRSKFPDVKISVRGKRLEASGPPILVAEIEGLLVAAQKPTSLKNAETTFNLTTRAQRGAVLATAAARANLVLVFDKTNRKIAKTLIEPVEVRAVNASLVELIRQTLDGTNLKFELVEGELQVSER